MTSSQGRPRTELMWLASVLALLLALALAYLIVIAVQSRSSSITLRIVSPAHGSVVTSPVTLRVESSGVEIAPPEAGVEGAAHYHAFADIHPFTPGGMVIPHEEGVHHFATETLQLQLEPGEHTIIVALGDNDHVRLTDGPAAFVDVTVVGE